MRRETDAPVHTRNPGQVHVADREWEPSPEWIKNNVEQIFTQLRGLRRIIEDRARPVDEYLPTAGTTSTGSVTINPIFDAEFAERIESILVWGSPAATGSIQLGDMTIPIVIPATGVLILGPLSLLLNRNDTRVLTLNPAGNIGMRLMGWADERY